MNIDLEGNTAALPPEDPLPIIDTSLGFLLLLIASVLLSFYSVTIQRKQLVLAQEGDTEDLERLPRVFPIKLVASAIVVGSLGYFLNLAAQTAESAAREGDFAARHSGCMNLWAALFVLAAALIRFYDLNFVERNQPRLLEQDAGPD